MGPLKDDRTDREFTNHFDPKNQACYIRILITAMRFGKNFGTKRFVSDVNENTTPADYVWMSQQGHKYWEVKQTMCN
ncbi:MAG: hypothetical protein ACJ746_13985 [Bryobacteraceae bacterium]